MKIFNISAIVFAISITFSVRAMAESMSINQFKFLEKNIENEYQGAIERCNALSEKASVGCAEVAKSNRNVSKGELQNSCKPAIKTKTNTSKARPNVPNGNSAEEDTEEDTMDSVAAGVKPFESNVIPLGKDIFRYPNKPRAM
jgi:hypothetical protein